MMSKQPRSGLLLRVLCAIAAFVVASTGSNVSADLQFNVATPINGDVPSGTLQATFVDNGSGVVDLTLTSKLSASSEFISNWGFNYVSSFTDVTHLMVSFVSSTGGASAADNVDKTLDNSTFNPPAVGNFDLVFQWTGSNHSFGPGSSVTYALTYTGSQTFSSSTFDATSSGGSITGAGTFYTAAKIQGIPNANSGELGNTTGPTVLVPEPSTMALAGLGALGFIGYGLRWRLKK